MSKNKKLYITSLAEYQTVFWIKVSKVLEAKNISLSILSFDDRSSEMLEKEQINSFNIPRLSKKENNALEDDFLNFDFKKWLLHEKITFNIRSENFLKKKYKSYLKAIDSIFKKDIQNGIEPILIQELGGFISVISSFFAARTNNIDNYFIEPSFFRSKVFLTKNSFSSPKVNLNQSKVASSEVKEYLNKSLIENQLVIPKKDRHQYTSSISKVLKFSVFKRLIIKIVDKYFLRKHQEFGYIYQYVKLHLIAIYNSFFLRKLYKNFQELSDFIYFPLHVPGDVALTLRSTKNLDQLSLIEKLCKLKNKKYNIVIKEHPAQRGTTNLKILSSLLKKYRNLSILDPSFNNYEVMSNSKGIITINSKSGVEAILLNKPVFVLGNSFYQNSNLVNQIKEIDDLPQFLDRLEERVPNENKDIESFFQNIWDASKAGELYVQDKKDIEDISESIYSIFKKI